VSPEKQDKRASALYKAIMGEFPPWAWKVHSAPPVEPTRATMNKIRSTYTAWAHRKAPGAAA